MIMFFAGFLSQPVIESAVAAKVGWRLIYILYKVEKYCYCYYLTEMFMRKKKNSIYKKDMKRIGRCEKCMRKQISRNVA